MMKIRGAEVLSLGGAVMAGFGATLNSVNFDLMLLHQTPELPYWLATESTMALGGLCMAFGFKMLDRRLGGYDPDDPEREDIYEEAHVLELPSATEYNDIPEAA